MLCHYCIAFTCNSFCSLSNWAVAESQKAALPPKRQLSTCIKGDVPCKSEASSKGNTGGEVSKSLFSLLWFLCQITHHWLLAREGDIFPFVFVCQVFDKEYECFPSNHPFVSHASFLTQNRRYQLYFFWLHSSVQEEEPRWMGHLCHSHHAIIWESN